VACGPTTTRMTRRQYSPSRNYIFIMFALVVAAVIGTGASASPNPSPGAPQNSSAPTVSGTPVQGQTLTVDNGSWSGNIQSYSYAWQRCSSSCAPIDGATDSSYTLAGADVGATVSAVVYASGKKGSTSATSNAVGPIAPLPTAPPPPPAPSPSPTVTITSPGAGSTVAGSVTVQATVANGTPTSVSLTLDGGSQWSGSTSPYAYSLDTTKLANGTHTLAAKAVFSDGSSVSANESVNVQNTTSTPPAPSATTTSRLGLWHLGSSLTGMSNLDKYGLVIVSADGAAQARALSARTLIYSNASGLESAYSEGLSYTTAKANGWLLGQGSNGKWVVDHTKAALNQAMADALVSYAKTEGLKGVFLDDVVPINPYGVTTPAGWRDGMVSFVHLVHQELQAAGLYLLVNANAFNDPSLGNPDNGSGDLAWAKLLAPDGVMTEEWEETRDGTYRLRTSGTAWYQNWDGWQAFANGVQAAGMDFVGLSFNSNASYGYASLLLQDAGRATYIHATSNGSDPWGTWAVNAGSAIDAIGTNPRHFTNATASVNATSASASL
jgi:Bacterial Ig domain